ncbi:MAG: hypothetical protein A4S08_00250 [Proteobacteria bacterium SG_bin4]|nr:MAG: hypothetical protein A4S08_00250 [Proteobacteria bacterium SG_bin4]
MKQNRAFRRTGWYMLIISITVPIHSSEDKAMTKPGQPDANELNIPEPVKMHPAWQRLEEQRKWYAAKSASCKNRYQGLRIAQVACAVMIPVFNLAEPSIAKWLTALSGAAIALLAGIEQINQYSTLWTAYRSTAERLKHEKSLFLSAAGPYRDQDEPARLILLAERIEEQISTEHAKWINVTNQVAAQDKKQNPGA